MEMKNILNKTVYQLILAGVLISSVFLYIFLNDKYIKDRSGPFLIMAQRFTPSSYPEVMINNLSCIESMPFDGMFINTAIGWKLMSGEPVSYEQISEEVKVLKGAFKKFDHNFLYIFINYPGDFWNDTVWTITAQNFANMAKTAKDLGCVGIVYDNEEYRPKKWLNYDEDYRNPRYDLDQHRDQVMLRGKQLMEAMVSEFPKIEILNFHGPYLSEPKTNHEEIIKKQAGSWKERELLGPFFAGMVQGNGRESKVIDGGEVYQYRTAEDFKKSYQWRKFGIASDETDSWFIPSDLRKKWADNVDIAYGVMSSQWVPGYPMNPEIMKSTLINALQATDKYVWYWTEKDSWIIPGEMPQVWIEAVNEGRQKGLVNKKK